MALTANLGTRGWAPTPAARPSSWHFACVLSAAVDRDTRIAVANDAPAVRNASRIYRFAMFELDAQALRAHGCPVELPARSHRVLLQLVSHQPRIVLRHELLASAWSDVRVTSGSLNQAIWEIRGVLTKHAAGEHYIRTYRNRGYQFVGRVETIDETRELALELERSLGQRWPAQLRQRIRALSDDALLTISELIKLMESGDTQVRQLFALEQEQRNPFRSR